MPTHNSNLREKPELKNNFLIVGPSEDDAIHQGNVAFVDAFPLVQLIGNKRIILEHYSGILSSSGRYEVR